MIIGAGISGLSAAYEALSYAREIVIVDENRIYQGSTASTTAKITVQHGFILTNCSGPRQKAAKLYYEYNLRGLKRIEEIVETRGSNAIFGK